MQAPDPSVAVVLANNLPAILTALAPIVASIVGLVIAYFNLKEKLAETRAATNQLINATKALRSRAEGVVPTTKVHSMSSGAEFSVETPIPEVPEKLK